MSGALRREGGDLLLQVHAQPGAKQSAFAGLHGDAVKIRLAAPAQDGRANDELRRFLADSFAVSLGAVVLLSGETSRRKRLRIVDAQALPAALAATGVL